MNKKSKSILAAVLVAGGGAVWLPQLVGANSSSSAPLPDIPADGPVNQGSFEGGQGGSGSSNTVAQGPGREGGAQAASSGSSDAADLEATLQAADTLVRRRDGLDLDELLAALDPQRRGAMNPSDDAPADPADHGGAEEDADAYRLREFAATIELTGTLEGPDPMCILDGRLVREGDRLDDGHVVVTLIDAAAIELARGAAVQTVLLAPFQARPAANAPSTPEVETTGEGPSTPVGQIPPSASALEGLNAILEGE